MMKGKNGPTARECRSRRRWMLAETYLEEMSGLIAKELYEDGNCSALIDIMDSAGDKAMYYDVKAITIAAVRLSEQLRCSNRMCAENEAALQRALAEQQRALADQQRTIELIRADCERRIQQVSTEHERIRAEALNIRRQAEADAQKIRADAEADAQKIRAEAAAEKRVLLSNVNALIEQDRVQCMEDAKRDAEQERLRLIEQYRLEAIDVYHSMRDYFTPDAIREAIDGYRREDSAAHAAAAERSRRAVAAFEAARTAYSAEMTRMQAQMTEQLSDMQNRMNEQLGDMQNRMSRSMMDWREQLYRLETMDLAQCAVNLSTILSGVDKRVGDAALQGDSRLAEGLSTVRRNLSRFEKQFRNALSSVGLEVYQPQPGDDFDPARHVLSEAGKDVDPDQPMTVSDCIRPGVLGSAGSGVEALIRAEVAACEKEMPPEIPAQQTPEQPACDQPTTDQPCGCAQGASAYAAVRETETTVQRDSRAPESPAPTVRPLFNQIIPGGDQA